MIKSIDNNEKNLLELTSILADTSFSIKYSPQKFACDGDSRLFNDRPTIRNKQFFGW